MAEVHVAPGLPAQFRAEAARLYFEAFWPKLSAVLGHDRLEVVSAVAAPRLRPERAVSAHDGDVLLGVAGFKRAGLGFADLSLADLRQLFGWWGGGWRGLALAQLDRSERPGELLMDGICVAETARGRGIGSRLLAGIESEARRAGAARIRLDVIDTNPRARALYERHGFRAVDTHRLGLLGTLFGFAAATEMHKEIGAVPR
jgi:ribosomal protein S18 acetylase RimI-like enzyme